MTALFILNQKLKAAKAKLKDWNKNVFGNLDGNVYTARMKVDQIQGQIYINGYSDVLFNQEKDAQLELERALNYQEEFWREKSRLNWYIQGDRNTEFFHKVAKVRSVTKQISMLRKDEYVLTNATDIENHIISYYFSLFGSDNACYDNGLIDEVISPLLSDEDNIMFTNLPTVEEVRDVVFAMNSNGAPCLDGFGAHFYQNY